MNALNKKVKDYIKNVLQMGILYILVGIGCFIVLLKVIENDPLINIPFGVLGIILGYYLLSYIDPGGRVDFWFYSSTKQTDDQKTVYRLIVQYKSKMLIFLAAIIFTFTYCVSSFSYRSVTNVINVNNIIWLLFWTTLTMLTVGNGVKYISAWWNISKKKQYEK
jgi:hypothetical protein